MREKLIQIIQQAVDELKAHSQVVVGIEKPADEKFGDFATNVAMNLAKPLKKNPREVAQSIIDNLQDTHGLIESTSIAGPGFINFKIKSSRWIEQLHNISSAKEFYGVSKDQQGKKVLVEFVSANPTGPLHIGHGRGAVVGDTLANLLSAVGYDVTREYYVNDGGVQITNLGKSVYARYKELNGEKVEFPEAGYKGDYIKDMARACKLREQEFEGWDEERMVQYMGEWAGETILEEIKEDLKKTGVVFDHYFFESQLYKDGLVQKALDALDEKNVTFDQDGAKWLKSTLYGDDKDRVLIKSDKTYTYLTPDIAYHRQKMERGFDLLVNVWGADHGGYVPRMQAALQGLGYKSEQMKVVLIQMVNLIKGGAMVSMSTRRAEYETLEDVRNFVGKDSVRYFFMMRSFQSQLDFDVDLAKQESSENPVYYIQYAHARICSIFSKAEEAGLTAPDKFSEEYATLLNLPEEIKLTKYLLEYPSLISLASRELEPHRVTFYVLELAKLFQNYYSKARTDDRYKVIGDHDDSSRAKLYLLGCVRQVIRNSLNVLGVSAPERM